MVAAARHRVLGQSPRLQDGRASTKLGPFPDELLATVVTARGRSVSPDVPGWNRPQSAAPRVTLQMLEIRYPHPTECILSATVVGKQIVRYRSQLQRV